MSPNHRKSEHRSEFNVEIKLIGPWVFATGKIIAWKKEIELKPDEILHTNLTKVRRRKKIFLFEIFNKSNNTHNEKQCFNQ